MLEYLDLQQFFLLIVFQDCVVTHFLPEQGAFASLNLDNLALEEVKCVVRTVLW